MMAKAPRPGAVKTRLCPPLSPEQAADLAAAFLIDTWAAAFGAFGEHAVLSRVGSQSEFPAALADAPSTEQSGADLGARIESAIEFGLARGDRVIVIGSDMPHLSSAQLAAAATSLESVDVCLGPSADGGFYLIGARRWQSGLLADLPWSSPETREATRARLAERGYAVAMTAPLDDIDDAADLERLRAELASDSSIAPETAAALARLSV